jgi:transcriptional regulator with XRE-family HTH domain
MALRHRTIAAMLRQARSEKNLSQKDIADRTGISSSRIRRYESGETPVPLPELEVLADSLGYDVDQFADNSGPVGEWIQKQHAEAKFDSLPRGLKEFVVDPDSRAYLEIAQKLKSISIEKLRALTESIGELLS